MTRTYRTFAIAAAILWPLQSQAHNFATGTAYPEMVEGAGASLNSPEILLTLIPIGLLASLWDDEGMLKIWPGLLIGMIVGIPLAPLVGGWIIAVSLAVGAICALMAVSGANYPKSLVVGIATALGALSSMVSFEGHTFGEFPLPIYIGILFGANLIVVIAAGIAKALLMKLPYFWTRIGLRVASSWVTAIGLMLLAFEMKKLVA